MVLGYGAIPSPRSAGRSRISPATGRTKPTVSQKTGSRRVAGPLNKMAYGFSDGTHWRDVFAALDADSQKLSARPGSELG